MGMITDINTVGQSAIEFTSERESAELVISGSVNGHTVLVKQRLGDGSFQTIKTIQAADLNAKYIIECRPPATLVTETTAGTGSPTLVAQWL